MPTVTISVTAELATALNPMVAVEPPPAGMTLDLEETLLVSYPDPVLNAYGRPTDTT